jgi:hypothetical protein
MKMSSEGKQRTVANSIKTPLGLASLMVTAVQAIALGIAGALSGTQGSGAIFLNVFYATVGFLVVMLVVVFVIAYIRPEALWGTRYSAIDEHFARGLGEEIFHVVDGYFSNGTPRERAKAYTDEVKG